METAMEKDKPLTPEDGGPHKLNPQILKLFVAVFDPFTVRVWLQMWWYTMLAFIVVWGAMIYYFNIAPFSMPNFTFVSTQGVAPGTDNIVGCVWPVPIFNLQSALFLLGFLPFSFLAVKSRKDLQPYPIKLTHAAVLLVVGVWVSRWAFFESLFTLSLPWDNCSVFFFAAFLPPLMFCQWLLVLMMVRCIYTVFVLAATRART